MHTSIVAKEQPVQKIFSDDYLFRIPGYQRPYAWTTEQAGELFDDLWGFMTSRDEEVEDMPAYFLGSIVVIKNPAGPQCEVVDGQQRLTTLTILLSAIRYLVDEESQQDLTRFIYESGSKFAGTRDAFRISLRPRDKEFFQDSVQRKGGLDALLTSTAKLSDSQSNIRENAKFLHAKLIALSLEERLKLAEFVIRRCYLVVVATPDLDSAFRIFAVLNSRGLELAATDILKAEIIGGIDKQKQTEFTALWEDMEEDLGRDAFGDLFSHVRMVYRKSKPQGTLLKEFRQHVIRDQDPGLIMRDVLLPMARAFREVIGADWSSTSRAEEVNSALKWLNRLIFSDWIPPALAFLTRNGHDAEATATFFIDLERLGYFLMVTRAGINSRIERFSQLTAEIEKGEDLLRPEGVLQLSEVEKAEFREALDGPLYYKLVSRALSAVLLRLDSLMSQGEATYDYPVISIEHVLPQNPSGDGQWITWFPDEDCRQHWTHRLGNLVLLSHAKNSAAFNYDFQKKKDVYFARKKVSPFVLTSNVLGETTWNEEILDTRQELLLELLVDHWKLRAAEGMDEVAVHSLAVESG